MLEIVIKSKCISIPLRQDKTIWSGSVSNDEYLHHGSQFFLAVSAKMGIDDVIKRVPQLVKVSATDEMQNLIRLSLPGLTLRHSPSPPSSILFKLENQYFGINQSGPLWERITQSRNVQRARAVGDCRRQSGVASAIAIAATLHLRQGAFRRPNVRARSKNR